MVGRFYAAKPGRRARVTGCEAAPRLPVIVFCGGRGGCGEATWGCKRMGHKKGELESGVYWRPI